MNGVSVVYTTTGGLIVLGIVIYAVLIYNGLIRLRNNIEKSWSNIEVLLEQRSNEIPNLVETVEGYAQHEREVMDQVTAARERALRAESPRQEAQADAHVRAALKDLFAVAEDYPDLKASENFLELQERISELEERIADRREYYNDAVMIYNTRIDQIPYVVIANAMDFEERELFEVDDATRGSIDLELR